MLVLVQADGVHLTAKAQCWLGRALAENFKEIHSGRVNNLGYRLLRKAKDTNNGAEEVSVWLAPA